MGKARTTTRAGRVWLAAFCATILAACSSGQREQAGGVLIFDEVVRLERVERRDVARREFNVDGKATFVVIFEEDDIDLKVRLSYRGGPEIESGKVEVNSSMYVGGIEIATLDAPPGTRVTVEIESSREFERPGKGKLRILRFGGEIDAGSPSGARLAAFRAWSAATSTSISAENWLEPAIRNIDVALAHFESADGDPTFAAWGRMVRAQLNNRQVINLTTSVADARRAAQGFERLGAVRNAARARIFEASTLLDISTESTARNPSAEEAAREAKKLLTALSVDPVLSAFERAYSIQFLGIHGYNVSDFSDARANFQSALSAYEAIGNRGGRRMMLQNLAVLDFAAGDYQAATQKFELVIAELDELASLGSRMAALYNAGLADAITGNVDRAIERLLELLELTREHRLRLFEARALNGLGNAYSVRGDMAQAMTLNVEALKLYRTLEDSHGLIASLNANGNLARATGDIPGALRLHREALSLSTLPDLRVSVLLELALDHAAASNHKLAVATCREALAIPVGNQGFLKRERVQLALAEALLSQRPRTPAAIGEATTLAQGALRVAILRANPELEIAARRLLAQSHGARADIFSARAEYERAIDLIFKYRNTINNPELQASTASHEQQVFRGYVDLLMRDVARRGPGTLRTVNASEENALRTLEWARAINFDAARVSTLDADTQARVDELLARMAGKRIRIAALADRSADATREVDLLQLDIAKLRAEVDGLLATTARDAKTIGGSPTVDAPWPVMPPGITQLSYALETDHAYLWVRDASGIRATVLAATPAAITRDLSTLAGAIRARDPQQLEAILAHLSTVLLPVDALGGDATTLEIVAEGRIARIPFAGLRSSKEPAQRLAERWSIEMIGSLFDARARPRPKQARALGFLALANQAGANANEVSQVFPALHAANAEAHAIAALFQRRDSSAQVKLLIGAEGSAGNLKKAWQDGVDVVHFATHGLADPRQPLAALLLLPALDATGSPTYLTAGQVQEWRGDADLVFLGACETAVGPSRFAEGLPGLQRAFLRAGSRGVIATLWPVEDMYASEFAASFYRLYIGGMRASQALSETQRAWLAPKAGLSAREHAHRRMTAWAHAFYSE